MSNYEDLNSQKIDKNKITAEGANSLIPLVTITEHKSLPLHPMHGLSFFILLGFLEDRNVNMHTLFPLPDLIGATTIEIYYRTNKTETHTRTHTHTHTHQHIHTNIHPPAYTHTHTPTHTH